MSLSLRRALFGIAVGVLLALLIAPQTRWLVLRQVSPGSFSSAEHNHQFVQSHPNDYPVQLAGQMEKSGQTQLEYARSLVPRFPENPSLRANILRYASLTLYMNRPEADGSLLSDNSPPQTFKLRPPIPEAELAAYDADAAAGERLDPDNAYFPFMRSIGLFAARKDAEGLAAIRRAGTKPAWREYLADEVEGHWRILDSYDGHHEAISAGAFQASVLFPQYQIMRAMARLVTERAVREEMAGQAEDGLTLRRSLAHVGDLMGTQGTTYITNLVGIAITSISRIRPGGAAPFKALPGENTSSSSPNPLSQRRLNAYCAYVTRLGHPEAAQQARAQSAAGEEVRQILSHQLTSGNVFDKITRLGAPFMAGPVLLIVFGLFLLLGLIGWAVSRLPRVRDRQPLPPGASVGIVGVLLLCLLTAGLLVGSGTLEDWSGFVFTLAVLLLVPLAITGLFAVLRPAFRRPFGHFLLAGGVTLAALAALFGLLFWLISHTYGFEGVNGSSSIGTLLTDTSGSSDDDSKRLLSGEALHLALGVLSAAALPVLLGLIFSLAARIKRVPVSAGVVQGFRLGTPLVLCLLAAGYAGLTLWTVRQENAANVALARSLHGEGQYGAQITGHIWPTTVQE